jgi:hypothetical protein
MMRDVFEIEIESICMKKINYREFCAKFTINTYFKLHKTLVKPKT